VTTAAAVTSVDNKYQTVDAAVPDANEGPLLQGVHFVASDDAQEHLLHQLAPVFVLFYDTSLAWIRMLECCQALHPDRPLQVQLLAKYPMGIV
jgi:hypothetical protein